MKHYICSVFALTVFLSNAVLSQETDLHHHDAVTDDVISQHRQALAENTRAKGFGPQSPRDIDSKAGQNARLFSSSPPSIAMNLCNIHFHKNAEHKGGQFSEYAGNVDGHGYQTGI
ncbi:MAG: hypothetical protein ACI9SC_002675 [Gammaproteobacteria bacterium]|jgi:hypothetical protein